MNGAATKPAPRENCPRRTKRHPPFPRHDRTTFVVFDLRHCVACGECVAACPRRVLGLVAVLGHRHAHVDRAAACKGCRKCMDVCASGVIRPRQAGGTTRGIRREGMT